MLDSGANSDKAASPIRLFGEILVPAALALLSLVVGQIIVGIAAAAHGTTPADVRTNVQAFLTSFYGIQIASLFLYAACYLLAEWRAAAAGRAPLRTLYRPLRWRGMATFLAGGIGGAFLLLLAILMWTRLAFAPLTLAPAEAGLMPGGRGAFDANKALRAALSLLNIGLIGPLVEEIFFRGLIQRWLAQSMPGVRAIVASAMIFALCHFKFALHFNSWGIVLTFGIGCLGVATGLLFDKYKSLTPGFVLHGSYNIALLAVNLIGHA